MEHSVRAAYATVAGVVVLLGLTFWVLLEPPTTERCHTSLPSGPYADALLPLHLVAAVALAAAALWLNRGRLTIAALTAVAIYVVVCLIDHAAFAPVGLVTYVLTLPAAAIVVLVTGVRAGLARRLDSLAAQALVWTALLIVLPGHFVMAWSQAVDLFCF
jgi:hypothetical protein